MTINSKLLKAYEFELMDLSIVCDSKRCSRMAMKVVVTHRIDTCDKLPAKVVSTLLCATHARQLERSVRGVVDRMTAELPKGTPLVCTSCGLQIQNYSDAIKLMELFDVS
jgi:hypothetical protein